MLALETIQGPPFGTYGASIFCLYFWKVLEGYSKACRSFKRAVTSSTPFDAFIPQSLHSYFPPHQFHRDTSHIYESPLTHLKTFNTHNLQQMCIQVHRQFKLAPLPQLLSKEFMNISVINEAKEDITMSLVYFPKGFVGLSLRRLNRFMRRLVLTTGVLHTFSVPCKYHG